MDLTLIYAIILLFISVTYVCYTLSNLRNTRIDPAARDAAARAGVAEQAPQNGRGANIPGNQSARAMKPHKRISISTNYTLFDGQFKIVPEFLELLKLIKDKYRIFLMTRVDGEDPKEGTYRLAQEALNQLVAEGILVSHRLMYCTTQIGQIAIIRQLSAELHMESNFEIVESLHQHINKFHLIKSPLIHEADQSNVEQFVKASSKVLYFQDVSSYTSKIKNALNR